MRTEFAIEFSSCLENERTKEMKCSIRSMMGVLTFFGTEMIAYTALALDGPMANATVSFGQWETDPPLDRLLGDPMSGVANNHELFPQIATIKEGGAVNFIISGGHVVAVYGDGRQPEDIDRLTPSLPPLVLLLPGESSLTLRNEFTEDRVLPGGAMALKSCSSQNPALTW